MAMEVCAVVDDIDFNIWDNLKKHPQGREYIDGSV